MAERKAKSDEGDERLRFALSASPMLVWEWDIASDRVSAVHDNLGIWEGGSCEAIFKWIHPEDRERVGEASARIAAGETPGATDFRLTIPGGPERWCSFRALRRCGADGRATHLYGVTLDITEQMLAAKEAERVKDEFLAMLSHELRTPLTPARALVQMLERDESLSPEHRDAIQEIGKHIAVEKRLIDDLLAFEHLAHDKVQLHLSPVDIHEQARHALEVCASLIRRKNLQVVESLTAADSVVLGDSLRLRQVLWNLFQNAVKFVQWEGTIVVRTANPEPGVLVLEVEDNGFGIEPGALKTIFEEFDRGGRGPDLHGGLGLGLTMSRRLAELHGGTLTAASPGRGHGSTFTLRLTTNGAAEAPARIRAEALPPAGVAGADRPLRILFVEDHAPTARAISRLLRSHGHTVEVASGLVPAEQAVEAEPFDLLLCDLQLPEGSGFDFLPRIRHHLQRWAAGGAEAPAIVLSGFARESDVARSLAAGYVAHLSKPVDQDELLDTIRRATAR